MPTNKLLPFANGAGANVQDEATWASLPDVATGFVSGLAVSKNFNRILAQGGAAGYAIGKVVVDWLGQDATIDATTLGTNFEAALDARYNKFGNYLPLAGGTMTGNIAWNVPENPRLSGASEYMQIGYPTGGLISLRPLSFASNPGGFDIDAGFGTGASVRLRGKKDGSLAWNGKEIERVDSSGSGWIRYTSGLQIVYKLVGGGYVRPISWTFPKAFASNPVVTATTYGQGDINGVSISALSTTSVTFTNGGGWSCYAIAIGAWK